MPKYKRRKLHKTKFTGHKDGTHRVWATRITVHSIPKSFRKKPTPRRDRGCRLTTNIIMRRSA